MRPSPLCISPVDGTGRWCSLHSSPSTPPRPRASLRRGRGSVISSHQTPASSSGTHFFSFSGLSTAATDDGLVRRRGSSSMEEDSCLTGGLAEQCPVDEARLVVSRLPAGCGCFLDQRLARLETLHDARYQDKCPRAHRAAVAAAGTGQAICPCILDHLPCGPAAPIAAAMQ